MKILSKKGFTRQNFPPAQIWNKFSAGEKKNLGGFTRQNFPPAQIWNKFSAGEKKNLGGFTLIELLVVVAIIGILSSVSMVSLNSARAKANAAKAMADVSQLRNAFEMAISDGCTNLTYAAGGKVECTAPAVTYIQRLPVPPSGYGAAYTIVPASPFNPSTTAYTVSQTTGFSGGQTFTCTGGSCWCNVANGCTQ